MVLTLFIYNVDRIKQDHFNIVIKSEWLNAPQLVGTGLSPIPSSVLLGSTHRRERGAGLTVPRTRGGGRLVAP